MKRTLAAITIIALALGAMWLPKVGDSPSILAEQEVIRLRAAQAPAAMSPEDMSVSSPPESRIGEIARLNRKTLLSHEEKRLWYLHASDTKTCQWATIKLNDKEIQETTRYELIDYLQHSMAWENNPSREEIFEEVENFLTQDLTATSDKRRKDQAGDKIELFISLLQEAPERAERLLRTLGDSSAGQILQYGKLRLPLNVGRIR